MMPWIQYSKTRCLIEILWRPNPAKPYSSKVPRRIPEIPLLLELVGTMSFLWKALKKLIDTYANTKKFTCWKLLRWFNLRKWLQSPKNVLNHYPELYPPKEKILRIVFWHILWEIEAKMKNFLRLSHLYKSYFDSKRCPVSVVLRPFSSKNRFIPPHTRSYRWFLNAKGWSSLAKGFFVEGGIFQNR